MGDDVARDPIFTDRLVGFENYSLIEQTSRYSPGQGIGKVM